MVIKYKHAKTPYQKYLVTKMIIHYPLWNVWFDIPTLLHLSFPYVQVIVSPFSHAHYTSMSTTFLTIPTRLGRRVFPIPNPSYHAYKEPKRGAPL